MIEMALKPYFPPTLPPMGPPTPRGGLFPSEAEIAMRLGQSPEGWAAQALVLEREGLPRVDPLMGGRYWRAVVAFLDRRSGLQTANDTADVDGEETWQ
jgi:hypothetical protein